MNYLKGDITKTDCNIIVHGCNAQGAMGSGVAKALFEKWPAVRDKYLEEYENNGGELPLGRVYRVQVEPDKFVFNAITQRYYGREGQRWVSYDAVYEAMRKVRAMTTEEDLIAMPMIGSGLGGGAWEIIEAIIEYNMKDRKVFIYEL